jgi:hypothetical protein
VSTTNRKILDYAALGGPAAALVTLVGWLIAGLLPLPLSPSLDDSGIAAFFTAEPNRVMAGFVLSSFGVVLAAPMFALISMHMLRAEGRMPILAFTQLIVAAVTVIINLFPQLIFAIAGFRADRDPSEVVLLTDLAWLMLFTGIVPFMIQNIIIGIVALRDTSGVFPRWIGYMNFLVAFSFIPDPLAFFFKSGPFAWNGVFVFWLALTTYCIFLVSMSFACRRANATLSPELELVAEPAST